MPTAPQIDAPISLGTFFPPESDDEDEDEEAELDQCFETQDIILADRTLHIRQYAYHSHNANRVWPGTFNLTDYLFEENSEGNYVHQWGSILELGTATGLLAIRLSMSASTRRPSLMGDNLTLEDESGLDTRSSRSRSVCTSVVTSDLDDDQVEDRVRYNFEKNGVASNHIHVPHTWGTGWKVCAMKKGMGEATFDTIVASDILLYVSAYAALVETLLELMGPQCKLVMSWNRRMKESSEFFDRMNDAGFDCEHIGKCVYVFTVRLLVVIT
jgi:hypothetical protein